MLFPAVLYTAKDATKLRTIADELFAGSRSGRIPADILSLAPESRKRLAEGVLELAAGIEAEPGPIEIALVDASECKYTTDESRDLLYLLRTALG